MGLYENPYYGMQENCMGDLLDTVDILVCECMANV